MLDFCFTVQLHDFSLCTLQRIVVFSYSLIPEGVLLLINVGDCLFVEFRVILWLKSLNSLLRVSTGAVLHCCVFVCLFVCRQDAAVKCVWAALLHCRNRSALPFRLSFISVRPSVRTHFTVVVFQAGLAVVFSVNIWLTLQKRLVFGVVECWYSAQKVY